MRYNDVVSIRPEGEWPGQDDYENFLLHSLTKIKGIDRVKTLSDYRDASFGMAFGD